MRMKFLRSESHYLPLSLPVGVIHSPDPSVLEIFLAESARFCHRSSPIMGKTSYVDLLVLSRIDLV